jgi:CheY-like chemotaxis protein
LPEQSIAATYNHHDVVTVLLVEDDPSSLRFYSEALRMSGFNVLAASTGSDALAKARARMPDAVVADLGLPDFDGFEVCRRLKQQPGAERLAAIALTGRSMALRDIDLAEQAGFASVLLKPSTPEAIAAAIASARRRVCN